MDIVFYEKDGIDMYHSTIGVPEGWTPRLLLGVLLLEWSTSHTISILVSEGKLDDIEEVRRAYFGCATIRLNKMTTRSPSYSFMMGGF